MIRTYTMRLKVTRQQHVKLCDLLEHLCVLYNSALDHRKRNWKDSAISINYYTQQKMLTEFRQRSPAVAEHPLSIQRDPLRRVDKAFRSFFRRCKAKQSPGFPRFKSVKQYDSFDVDADRFRFEGKEIVITKLGGFRFKTRCKVKGQPKVLRVKRQGKHWIASVSCDLGESPSKVEVSTATGIDLGLTMLATLSDGTEIENPRWTKRMEDKLADANRSLSRKVSGSKNRVKAKEHLRRVHQCIAGMRSAYLTAVAKKLVGKYDLIAHEDLKVSDMVQSRFGKSIMDAAWSQLIYRLTLEAENAGKWVIAVNPRGTTQLCSGCGEKVPKKIWHRTHDCPSCGRRLGRDHNAALNILALGRSAAETQ